MTMNEFDDAYEDKQKLQGAIVTEPISALKPAIAVTVRPTTTVLEAVKIMNQKKCGCVCVTEGDKLVGIFTERDVLTKVVEQALDTKKTTVDKVMTRNPETLMARDKIAFALNRMHVGGFRHIPLVEKGKLTGIISIRDIADFVVALFPDGVLNVPPDPSLGIPTRPDGG
jgi:predicted transcriptional regulator